MARKLQIYRCEKRGYEARAYTRKSANRLFGLLDTANGESPAPLPGA